MPRRKKKSYERKKLELKLKRRKLREEELQLLSQIDGNSESIASDHPVLTRSAKHAEYVRNYRKNMPEEKKQMVRALAAWRMAQRRKNMSEEQKRVQREYHRQRMAFKRKNMSQEERKIFRENQRLRSMIRRQNMTEEQKHAAREADRQRMAMKRKKWKENSDSVRTAMARLALQRQNYLPPPVDKVHPASGDDAPLDMQRFLAITLVTGHSITFN